MSELPEGWKLARVGEIIDFSPKNHVLDEVEVGFVPMHRMGIFYQSKHSFETKLWAEIKKGYTHFANGDVLLARITPCFENGKGGIARDLPNGLGAGSTEYFVCRPFGDILISKYLLAFFKTKKFLNDGKLLMNGAVGQQRVPKDYVLNSEIPLAPLNEQKRIADKLDNLLGRVDACQEHLKRVPLILKRFRQSVLAAATSGRLTEEWREKNGFDFENDWHEILFVDYVKNHDGKRIPISEKLRNARHGNYPYYGASGVIDVIDDFTHDGKFLLIGEDGANLLTRSKPIAFIAKGRIWVNNHAHVLSCQHGEPEEYLGYFINSIDLSPFVSGSAQPKLNQQNMNRIVIPVPPVAEQHEIVRRVEALFAMADRLEARWQSAQKRVAALTPSLLAKAFRGELVEQDANDEPAEVLLERIKAQTAGQKRLVL